MKKNRAFLLTICAAGLLFACVNEADNQQNNDDDDFSTGGDSMPMVYIIDYTVTVVNNTNKKVQLYGPGHFIKYLASNEAEISGTLESRTVVCTIPTKGQQTGTFYWNTGKAGFYDENYEPSIETIKANFKPYIASFYLKFTIGSDEYYLAGWPAADGNNLVDYQGKPSNFPASKVKANGIGYCKNTEIRIDKNGYAYIPFTLNYDGKHRDFGDATGLTATATLTINSPDDIQFKTTSLK